MYVCMYVSFFNFTLQIHPLLSTIFFVQLKAMQQGKGSGSISLSTVSKDNNLVLSSESEDSCCPDESELQLGLSLTLSSYADFPSSSSSLNSRRRTNVTSSGTKRPAHSDSHSAVATTNGPSQVVGWPPLGAYRMNSYNSHAKSPATEVFNSTVEKSKSNRAVVRKSADNGSDNNSIISKENRNPMGSLFVKVKMDGMPIGRKVDLSAHSSYETLSQTLEDMFNEPTTVLTCKVGADGQSKLLDGSSNFVLTYEDKEGDWMLVGDVPWWMFLSSVRRLRIMRTSEANGLAPRLEEKNSRLKSNPV